MGAAARSIPAAKKHGSDEASQPWHTIEFSERQTRAVGMASGRLR